MLRYIELWQFWGYYAEAVMGMKGSLSLDVTQISPSGMWLDFLQAGSRYSRPCPFWAMFDLQKVMLRLLTW